MARLDRRRLESAQYPFVAEIPVRYDDLDTLGHVNNAATVVILQEARAQFARTGGLRAHMRGLHTIVVSITVEYADEILYPGVVQVSTGLVSLGRTSLTMAQVIRQKDRPAVYAETVLVMADANKAPIAVPDPIRALADSLTLKAG